MSYLGTQPNNIKQNTGLYSPSQILELEKDGHWGGSLELIQAQSVSANVPRPLESTRTKYQLQLAARPNRPITNRGM